MLGSETSTDTASSSSLSPLTADMLKSLSLASYDAESIEDTEMTAQIDLVLEMTATFDTDGFQLPSKVTRKEVQRVLEACDGDVSRAVDDVLSLVAIKTLSQQDQHTLQERQQRQQEHAKLQLSELCSGLGLDEDSSFVAALQQLPESERDDLLSTNGVFVQQLLLSLDEDSEDGSEAEDMHPLQYLLEMYPDYKAEVVEDVLDSHNYDVEKAADALHNLRALNHVQSYATVVNADARAAAQQRELYVNGPKVDSLGQFPELGVPSKTQQKKLKRHQRRQQKLLQAPHQRPPPKPSPPPIAYPMLPARKHLAKGKTKPVYNAWDHQAAPHDRADIDASVIQTTFFLNGCSSDATEAALREIYNLPLVEKHLPPPTVTEEVELAAAAADAEEELAANSKRQSRRGGRSEDWTLVSSKHKVNTAKEKLSNRYCDVLASFRRGQHVLAADRVRELSKARREHRDAQRQWAHDFFLAHEEHVKHQRPIDLHGMIVMEALWVAREAIEYCQEHRIRRCLLICGVGHHSINGKPRILSALQLSLQRRQIASRELNGVVTVFPLRSTDAS
ncbi:Smr domain [Phytophthora infestans]|uniref:Smr domain n=1 Tax=Phytophthora infestans TaxID=4787 RepID=A0A833W296_PHYIN|nr:Smr domain [Phytophthora infestans]